MRYLTPFVAQCLLRLGLPIWCRRPGAHLQLLEPGGETPVAPALYDDADLPKITGVPSNTSLAWQLEKLSRRTARHRAVYARSLRGVLMAQGHLFRWNMIQPLANNRLPKFATSVGVEVERAVVASTELGNKFFGHWLLDDVLLEVIARGLGSAIGPQGTTGGPSRHQIEYAGFFGSGVPLLRDAFFDELVIVDERPEGPAKAAQYRRMRESLPRPRAPNERPGVMILRKTSGQMRVLWNELQIAEALSKRGFSIVDPMVSGVAEIVDACWDARIVVGVEGSQLAHGFLPMRPGGTMLTLQPPFKFDLHWKDRCDCVGAGYAFLVGDAVEDGFHVEVESVHAMVDRILR